MTDRCTKRGFYAQGIKLHSGTATFERDGVHLAVVIGRDPVEGEISVRDLPEGAVLRVDSLGGLELRFQQQDMYGRAGRRMFDPYAVAESSRDDYLAAAVSSMAIGARESSDYADRVLQAVLASPGPRSTEALLAQCRRVLDVGYQQFDEVEGARLLAYLAALASSGETVPMDWVEDSLSKLHSWHAFAMLSSPGVLPSAVEDMLLSQALSKVRTIEPDALPGHHSGVIDGSRSDAERIRLRADLLQYMALRPTIENTLPGSDGHKRHSEFFTDALYRASLLAEPSPPSSDRLAELRVDAARRADELTEQAFKPAAASVTAPRRIPQPPRRRPERLSSRAAADRELEINEEIHALEQDISVPGRKKALVKLRAERERLVDLRESRYVRAQRFALLDVNDTFERARGEAPCRPAVVEMSLWHLERDSSRQMVCEALLPAATAKPSGKSAAKHAADVERNREMLARAIALESRTPREIAEGYRRPSIFDHEHGPGVQWESGFTWSGPVTDTSPNVDPALAESALFVRAQLVHAALAADDDRFLKEVRQLVLSGGRPGKGSRLTLESAWETVRNLETVMYLLAAINGVWSEFEHERALMLSDRSLHVIARMRAGAVRLGADPLRASYTCLAALREVEYCWHRLHREVEGAMRSPAVRKSKSKMAEHQALLPPDLPEGIRKAIRSLPRPGPARSGHRNRPVRP